MTKSTAALACALISTLTFITPAAAEDDGANGYTQLEVGRFEVERESFDTKEAERAGAIPEEMLDSIQRAIQGEMTRSGLFATVMKSGGESAGGERTLVVSGRVTDFKAGSRTARLWVGMGAGKQLIEVECALVDRETGEVVARQRIIDRKVGGWGGGSEEKGLEDFAEKVHEFIRKSLNDVE